MRTRHLLTCFSFLSMLVPSASGQSVTTLQPGPMDGKDAHMKSCIPCGNWNTNNYGSHPYLFVMSWTFSGTPFHIRSILDFDLTTLPVGAEILDARLSLYHDPNSSEGPHSSMSGPNSTLIMRVTEPWSELSVTWDSQPATTAQNQVVLPPTVSPDQDYVDIDVTAMVSDMVADPAQGHGFLLRLETEDHYRRVVFASSNHADASVRPKLVITHQGGVGIEQHQAELPAIHPNPTQGRFVVEGATDGLGIEVFDALGTLVHGTRSQGPAPVVVDLEGRPSGVYFVWIRDAMRSSVQRIVLQ